MKEKYDAIIIGSGPGGAGVARELALKGKKVVILERGGNPRLKNNFFQYFLYQLIPFKSFLITNRFLGMVRGLVTGGSSVFYYGTSFKVPIDMLKKYGVDLTRESEEIKKELGVAPLKDEMMTPMATRIMKSARELGYDWKRLDKFMDQKKWKPGMKFGYYGDPHDIKWSARMWVFDAVKKGALLINHAKAGKIIFEGKKAVGVEYRKGLLRKRIYGDRIVLSAGGIGSPVVLARSGIKGTGRNYFFDPLISVCGTVDDLRAGAEIPMSGGVHLQDRGYMMTDMSLPPMISAMFALQVFRFHRMFSQKKTLRIMIKIKDTLGGKITRLGQVRKELSPEDLEKLKDGASRAKEILEKAGAKNIYKTWYLAAHPGGTVKIGEFLDSNLKMKGYENLFVCDCSVIPEPWGLPPTLTLLSLARRLGRYLAG